MKLVTFVTGSRSYNLSGENSDNDYMVVMCEPLKLFELGETGYRQTKTDSSDNLEVSLRDYLRHLHKGNAAYVQTLFNRSEDCFGLETFLKELKDNAHNFLNAENVHKSFTGVAVRMYREYKETGKAKSASEAMRYLLLLQQLHAFGSMETFSTGFMRDYLYELKFCNRTLHESTFYSTVKVTDDMLECSVLANNTQEFANKFSVEWYTKVVDSERQE